VEIIFAPQQPKKSLPISSKPAVWQYQIALHFKYFTAEIFPAGNRIPT
jgi:hypothetical protein